MPAPTSLLAPDRRSAGPWLQLCLVCSAHQTLPCPLACLAKQACPTPQALRRLIVFGFQSDARTLEPVGVVSQTVPVLLQALQTLLAARPAKGAPRSQLAVMLDRGLIKLAKVITNVQEAHPWYDLTLCYHHCARGSFMVRPYPRHSVITPVLIWPKAVEILQEPIHGYTSPSKPLHPVTNVQRHHQWTRGATMNSPHTSSHLLPSLSSLLTSPLS